MKERVKTVQRILQQKGLYDGAIDGIAGPRTIHGLSRIEDLNRDWPMERKIHGFIQLSARENNINPGPIDGIWGPQTAYAYQQLAYLLKHGQPQENWRPEELIIPNPHRWPVQHSPEFHEFFGKEGEENLTLFRSPYPMNIAWEPFSPVRNIRCHHKVAESLERILVNVREIYGERDIRRLRLDSFGGCYNFRPMKNGTLLSMHSWGIAVDFDPMRNQFHWGRDRAVFARPDYLDWWKCWEKEGWISLGRTRNFDWMHIQAARII